MSWLFSQSETNYLINRPSDLEFWFVFDRNFFLTQFQDGDNLETGGLLEIDFDKLSFGW